VWSKTVENFIFSIVAAYSKAAQRATPRLTFYIFRHKQLLLTTPGTLGGKKLLKEQLFPGGLFNILFPFLLIVLTSQ